MGRSSRPKPHRLADKLLHLRRAVGLSQNGMIRKMGLDDQLLREEISDFERGKRVPPLHVILMYARISRVSVETLIDDELNLPQRLMDVPMSAAAVNRKIGSRKRSKAKK